MSADGHESCQDPTPGHSSPNISVRGEVRTSEKLNGNLSLKDMAKLLQPDLLAQNCSHYKEINRCNELDIDAAPDPRLRKNGSYSDCVDLSSDLGEMINGDGRLRHLGHLEKHWWIWLSV